MLVNYSYHGNFEFSYLTSPKQLIHKSTAGYIYNFFKFNRQNVQNKADYPKLVYARSSYMRKKVRNKKA